jgi:putative transposase
VAQELERSHSLRITAHHARPHLEEVHGLGHQRIALRPVVAPAGDKPDADRVTSRHEPKPVVLDLVDPVGTCRGLVGCGWEAGFDEGRPVGGKPQGSDGVPVADICRKAGISQATYFNWKKKLDGLLPTEMRRLKQLEDENSKLKKLVADLSLDREMLQDVIRRKL